MNFSRGLLGTAGKAQTPAENREGQTAGGGERRQEGAKGGRLNLLLQAALKTGRRLPAGVHGQEPRAEPSTAHPAQSPAFDLEGGKLSRSLKRGRGQCWRT